MSVQPGGSVDPLDALALDKARLDNEAAQLANAKARQDLSFAVRDRLTQRLKEASTDISAVPAAGVVLQDGYIFRGAELADELVEEAADDVCESVAAKVDPSVPIFVTDGDRLAESGVMYALLLSQVSSLHASALRLLAPTAPGTRAAQRNVIPVGAAEVVADALDLVPAAFALSAVDASLGGATVAIPGLSVQLRLAGKLLSRVKPVTVEAYAPADQGCSFLTVSARSSISCASWRRRRPHRLRIQPPPLGARQPLKRCGRQ
jgi:hypothetical protein